MRDHRANRLGLPHLAQLLIDVASVDRETAGRAERLAMRPGESGDRRCFDHSHRQNADCVSSSMPVLIRIALVILAVSLTAGCTYLPVLPSRNDAPQIKPPVPKLP